jgi:hypothetical protein
MSPKSYSHRLMTNVIGTVPLSVGLRLSWNAPDKNRAKKKTDLTPIASNKSEPSASACHSKS